MADSKGRAGRLRAMAFGVLLAGAALAFLAGAAFPAPVTVTPAASITAFTSSTDATSGAFNWLFVILILGPTLISSSLLFGCGEIVGGLRRSSRTRSSEGSGATRSASDDTV